MQKAPKLHDLTENAVEALQLALVECRQATTEGLILAALALVAQMQHELSAMASPSRCDDAGELCFPT
ncbi:hypothetical protein [Geobacter sp. DSM 9736]|uniref:hypothetical protein n=1 Tax=Geobacter sp. DSM 9736 TaxID=1277350 RepID=UPI000B512CB1|nr:hypothetical protein [Geobacter sp. DSM 9736]SNB47149.1 hypothetical protein SAMN06269301_2625 [Geobacter sp. DSM 9736]